MRKGVGQSEVKGKKRKPKKINIRKKKRLKN